METDNEDYHSNHFSDFDSLVNNVVLNTPMCIAGYMVLSFFVYQAIKIPYNT